MRAIITATVLSIALPTVAQELSPIEQETDPVVQQAMNNWHHEMVVCSAYYLIGVQAMMKVGDNEAAKRLQAIADVLTNWALSLHRPETTTARMKLAVEDMANKMHNHFSNWSIIIVEYESLCKQVVEDSDKRLAYWDDEALKSAQR
jgi:hypothetical protein